MKKLKLALAVLLVVLLPVLALPVAVAGQTPTPAAITLTPNSGIAALTIVGSGFTSVQEAASAYSPSEYLIRPLWRRA